MPEKIDIFDPVVIIAFIVGVIGDFSFAFALGLIIPGLGIVLGMVAVLMHYLCGGVAVAIFWHKTKGWLATLVLIIALALPLPLISIGLVLAIVLSNKFVAFFVEQAGIQLLAIGTAGAGELAEVGVAAELGAEAVEAGAAVAEGAAAAAEGAEVAAGATTEAAEGARQAARAGEEVAEGAEGTARAGAEEAPSGRKTPPEEALGEQPEPMEKLQKDLLGEQGGQPDRGIGQQKEAPEAEAEEEKPGKKESEGERRFRERLEKAQKVKEQIEKLKPSQEAPQNENEEENYEEAA